MSEQLKRLSGAQKKAVVGLACMVAAQENAGRFRTNDPEVDIIIRHCFDEGWVGNWDTDYRHHYMAEAATSDMQQNQALVTALDMETKVAFKNLLIEVMGDSAIKMVCASYLLKEIGLPSSNQPPQRESSRIERNTEEADENVAKDTHFARIADVRAVRENQKLFRLQDGNGTCRDVVGNYLAWREGAVCPTNGLVGFYLDSQCEVTPEGRLCFLICEDDLVVPTLERGLEEIDDWNYREKRQYNRILSVDKSGARLDAFRSMDKTIDPDQPVRSTNESDRKVVHFMATVQQRFEPNRTFPTNYILRQIQLTYTKQGSHLELEVMGVMMPRHAVIENDDGRILTYRDTTNKTTYYEVETEPRDNSIVRVSVFQMLNLNMDYVEYRYTTDRFND